MAPDLHAGTQAHMHMYTCRKGCKLPITTCALVSDIWLKCQPQSIEPDWQIEVRGEINSPNRIARQFHTLTTDRSKMN